MPKMTKTSRQNLLIADLIRIESNDTNDGWFLLCERGVMRAYVSSKDAPIAYATFELARLAAYRVRPDLPVSTI